MNPLVPAAPPGALPGPAWLFHVIWLITFVIHLLLINLVLGGAVVSVIALARGRGDQGRDLVSWSAGVSTWAIPFAITFAIAPLLCYQVLYGPVFYSATILVAGGWLSLLGLLTVAYYVNYLVKHRLKVGGTPFVLVLLQALLFLAIAGMQVAVNLLQLRPDRWGQVSDRPWSVLLDPSFAPRYLHFVAAAIALTGLALAWWRTRVPADRAAPADAMKRNGMVRSTGSAGSQARFGLQLALAAGAAQIPIGFWLLFSLPRAVLLRFMQGGVSTMLPLTLGILTAVGLVVVLALSLAGMARPRLVRHALELAAGTVVLMVLARHSLRGVYLTLADARGTAKAAPQWGVIGLFVLCLLLAAGLTVLVLRRAAGDRPGPGEDAA